VPVHGPPEDGRRRVEGRRTGPEDLLRHTRERGHTNECEDGSARGAHGGVAHGRGDGAAVERCGQGNDETHKWDKRQRIKDQHGEREIEFADVDDAMITTW